ncbi:MAG: TSCPD domain-containing protein [Christensenellales bacterium]|jgi:uncharacterized protein (TIGR03905 family)|nr:TSCPD domain-containing protein [Clostridiales bacterium]
MKKFTTILALILALVMSISSLAALTPGEYEGVGEGRNGDVKVKVTIDETGIKDIEIIEHQETDGFWERALEGVKNNILERQTFEVDAVAQATLTRNALIEAVAKAIEASGTDPVELGYVPPALPDPSEQIVETGADKEGIRNFTYTTQGNTCSTKITFVIKEADMTVYDLVVYDGCDGNARGFAALADGSEVDDIIQRFLGIPCHASDGSSCPDQVAKALNEARFLILGERLEVEPLQ